MKRILMLLAMFMASLQLVGCASMHFGNEKIADEQILTKLETEHASKEDVYIQYGQPHFVLYQVEPANVTDLHEGKCAWTYLNVSSKVTGATYIPIVGIFAGGSNLAGDRIKIFFDEKDTVERIEKNKVNNSATIWALKNYEKSAKDPTPEIKAEMEKLGLPVDEKQAVMFKGTDLLFDGKNAQY